MSRVEVNNKSPVETDHKSLEEISNKSLEVSNKSLEEVSNKYPKGIPYIIGNELAERFSYYGMKAILVVFMTQYLMSSGKLSPMNENEATTWYHVFSMANYFFPIIGAVISDVLWGKYKTINKIDSIRWKLARYKL